LVEGDGRPGFIVKKLRKKEVEEYFSIRKAFEAFAAPLASIRLVEKKYRKEVRKS
jgi:DNA-binding GntR family transcriptional regulator